MSAPAPRGDAVHSGTGLVTRGRNGQIAIGVNSAGEVSVTVQDPPVMACGDAEALLRTVALAPTWTAERGVPRAPLMRTGR